MATFWYYDHAMKLNRVHVVLAYWLVGVRDVALFITSNVPTLSKLTNKFYFKCWFGCCRSVLFRFGFKE